MRIVGYARLSRASREESTSIVRQRELIEKTCEVRGMQLVETVVDDNISATRSRPDRPGLSKVRQMIRDGEADAAVSAAA
jgi:DNA invertase Pin-like site-specific DNA recombinase